MPYATLIYVGAEPAPEIRRTLLEKTAEVLIDVLQVARPLIAVRLVVEAPGDWSVGGRTLAAGGNGEAGPPGLLATLTLAESSADETRIAAAIAALAVLFRNTLGANALPPYVVVERIPDALWGYKGRTLAQIRRS